MYCLIKKNITFKKLMVFTHFHCTKQPFNYILMRTFTFTAVLLLLITNAFAQAPAIEWQKSLGGTNQEYAFCVRQTSDGGYIVAGETVSPVGGMITNNYGSYDCWVVKLDTTGALQWQKALGGSDYDRAYSVEQTADGGYIVIGMTYSNNFDVSGQYGTSDVWVVKLSTAGAIEWQKTYGGSSLDEGYSIKQTADGGYILSGVTFSTNGLAINGQGGWILKLSSTGTVQWQKTIGGYGCYLFSIQQTTDGGYVTAGYSNGPLGNTDFHIIKLDSAGTITWQKFYGGTASDYATSIQQTADGGYIVAGNTNSSNTDVTQNNGSDDYWIIKLDSTGALQWQKALGGAFSEFSGRSVQQTSDLGYIVCGYTNSNNGLVTGNHGDADYWVVKLDNSGSIAWQKTLGGTGTDWGQCIQQTADGGYIVAGTTGSYNGDVSMQYGDRDFWVAKLSPENLNKPDFTNENKVAIYPNPTKDFFKLSNYKNIQRIELYDINGKKLLSKNDVIDENISLQNFSKGVYPIKIYLTNGAIVADKIIKE